MTLDLRHARFRVAAHRPDQWPADAGVEVAFAGRSNVGKSSAINAIAGVRALARTSKTPGRTQQIIFFELDRDRRLVDLPGYGYARVSDEMRRHWERVVERYLTTRSSLAGLVLAMDVRRPLTGLDRQMLTWCAARGMGVHILLTKADKLASGAARQTLGRVQGEIEALGEASAQLFSATRRHGLDAGREQVLRWLTGPPREREDGPGERGGPPGP